MVRGRRKEACVSFLFIVRMREKGGCVSFLGREIEDVKKKGCVCQILREKRGKRRKRERKREREEERGEGREGKRREKREGIVYI